MCFVTIFTSAISFSLNLLVSGKGIEEKEIEIKSKNIMNRRFWWFSSASGSCSCSVGQGRKKEIKRVEFSFFFFFCFFLFLFLFLEREREATSQG
jgi:hypothetical protein